METPAPQTSLSEIKPQNYTVALAAGIVAAIIGGIAWAVITVMAEYQLGLMAIGVGLLVGFAVRLGNGAGPKFACTGAALALLGCLLGNFLSMIGFYAKAQNLSVFTALSAVDYANVPGAMISAFDVMDLVFYGIAVYEGYRFSTRREMSEPGAK
jgi:hypothetical protein